MTSLEVLAMVLCTISCSSYEDKPSVILIIIDTLRADHLSCYGYERITSPVLDSLAATGTIWANANSNASWTLPATASIWTGVAPKSHGVTMSLATGNVFGISPETPVLPMAMKSNGYQTAGFFNVYLFSPYFGFHKGFDRYDCTEKGHDRAEETVDMAIQWLEEIDHEKPFFLTVHLFDVHAPYDPPAPFNTLFCNDETDGKSYWDISENGDILHPEQLEHLMGLYDGEIAQVDSELGRLFRTVRDLELDQKTLIIVTADHGEEFLEHGYVGHGKNLFQETVHIPLITSGTEVAAGAVRHETVAQFDIFPSILSYCACLTDNRFDGISFFSESLPENRFIPASEINRA
ncbi:hypothetical protein CSA37_11845 [Candidatus Fermentibacteria bacterium]|nr:MAG: hypothetical protein CSA37_11845 [Candidatus Fermentibacteria bacterium]